MASVKTAISLDESLFEQVESLARALKLSRSRVIALALEEFVRRREDRRLLEAINATCEEEPGPEDLGLLRGMRRLQRQALEGEW
ncbi:MAG: ribbon-helix-helix protein, CopG family [Chloroflexi bacterium]|nr:ribbon-helix-helix protein, CopG family [Chloroflexota bacterium]